MEKVLPYNISIVPQETGYWCGPAAAQVILDSLGIRVSEQDMANRMRTHQGGTDSLDLVAPVLNKFTDAGYKVTWLWNDPPTASQTAKLWDDIVGSIDAGYGVHGNLIAPRNNYPRGTRGSASPAYSGGTVYHYIAIMGYYDGPDGKHVWIADSGFRPYGYWVSLTQLASLLAGKGYAAASKRVSPPGFLSALTDAEQREVLDMFRQLGQVA